MNFNKQLLECLKSVVLKDFKTHTKDKGGSCIEEACLQVFNSNKNKYIDFIEQWEVCEAQGNNATQAHHLIYERVFDEPLFDLISICTPFHEKLHNK